MELVIYIIMTFLKVWNYIHRIGRTGRAGEEGYTCLFVDPKDKRTLEEIEKRIKFKIPRRELNL